MQSLESNRALLVSSIFHLNYSLDIKHEGEKEKAFSSSGGVKFVILNAGVRTFSYLDLMPKVIEDARLRQANEPSEHEWTL